MTERTYWQKLKKIGWLDYLPQEMHAEVRKQLKQNLSDDPQLAFLALTQGGFDIECIMDAGTDELSYAAALRDLAEVSRGVFEPTQIEDAFVKRRRAIQVSFRHGRKKYSCIVPYDNDYFDMTVLELVNRALAESDVKQRFIVLPDVDQFVNLVFVPPQVYAAAVREKLVPSQDELSETDTEWEEES